MLQLVLDMDSKVAPVLMIGILIAFFFVVSVYARLAQGGSSSGGSYNEVSPSADLAVDFGNRKAYLFSSVSCPHCRKVAEYLETRLTLMETLDLTRVSLDDSLTQGNYQAKLAELGNECGIAPTDMGIPFLYLNDPNLEPQTRCLSGDESIIAYFGQFE
jgi:glutaredoxin